MRGVAAWLVACAAAACDKQPAGSGTASVIAPTVSASEATSSPAAPDDARSSDLDAGADANVAEISGATTAEVLESLGGADGGVALGGFGTRRPFAEAGAPATFGGSPAVGGGAGLTPGQVKRVVMSNANAVRACYESARADHPGLAGQVTIAWTVEVPGNVSKTRLLRPMGSTRVEGCLLRQIARWRFPSSAATTDVVMPFSFSAPRDAGTP